MPDRDDRAAAEGIPAVRFEDCAAKTAEDGSPGASVLEHCIAAGRVAERLFRLLPESLREKLSRTPGLAVALHDAGKVSPGFQLKYFEESVVREKAPGLAGLSKDSFNSRHASVGAAAIDRWLGERFAMKLPISCAVAAHHGICDSGYPKDKAERNGGAAWAEERERLYRRLCGEFHETLCREPDLDIALQAGLTSVSDWIASDEAFFPAAGGVTDFEGIAERAVEQCGFDAPRIRPRLSFRDLFGFEPNAVQKQFIEKVAGPGVYVLEAPMGIGKTEAALAAAYRLLERGVNRGIYFALPTRLTSDRIHLRVQEFIRRAFDEKARVRLAHGTAWLENYGRGGKEFRHSWFDPAKRSLLDTFAVGTVDQALFSVMNVHYGFVRLFGLAGKVVILDEIHSYDLYTGTLLDDLVKRLGETGCTVIILSATLTAQRRGELVSPAAGGDAYPLLSGAPCAGGPFAVPLAAPAGRTIALRREALDAGEVAAKATESARKGVCVVCIADTVAKAQEWYRHVRSELAEEEGIPAGLLHSRFPAARREKLEEEWMERLGKDGGDGRKRGCVLVATQVVEQSVDIDADELITEPAPVDMLLQRMGRLWRHERAGRPVGEAAVTIIAGDALACRTKEELFECLGKGCCRVYDPYVLLRTAEALRGVGRVSLPGDIRGLLESVYRERGEDDKLMQECLQTLLKRKEKLRNLAMAAGAGVRSLPTQTDNESRKSRKSRTRYSDYPTADILLARSVEGDTGDSARVTLPDDTVRNITARDRFANHDYFMETVRALHRWTVKVPSFWLPESAPKSPEWLKSSFYVPTLVVTISANLEMSALYDDSGKETGLYYREDLGIWRGDGGGASFPVFDTPFDTQTNADYNFENDDW